MNDLAIFTVTSGLHDEASVSRLTDDFLKEIFPDGRYDFPGADFSSFGERPLDLIYIRTGGTEGLFLRQLPELLERGARRFLLLTSGKSNSLAASLEILSYLRQKGLSGEVVHGNAETVRRRIGLLMRAEKARRELAGKRIGIIGKPSDWLIASGYDTEAIRKKLGVEVSDIPLEELLAEMKSVAAPEAPALPMKTDISESLPGAMQILEGLRALVRKQGLGALTLRCFDLLTAVRNTGCLALSVLNGEGLPSSCEGDVPALVTMMISKALTGKTGFQANPAHIDVASGEILFAHCTIATDIVDSLTYDTHFESGIGVGLHGHFPEGPVTVFKVSGALDRYFVSEGTLLRNQYEDNLCRTQVILRLPPEDASYFLKDPIANHHIIIPGRHKALIEQFICGLS